MIKAFYKKIIVGETVNSFFIIATKPLTLVNAFFIIGSLSLNEYGLYVLLLAFQTLVAGFSMNFMDNLVLNEMNVYYGEKTPFKARKIFREYAMLKVLVGAGLTLAIFLGSDLVSKYIGSEVNSWVKIISFLFILDNVKSLLLILFQYQLRFFFASLYSFAYEFLKLLLLIFLFFQGWLGVTQIVVLTVATNLFVILLLAPFAFGGNFGSEANGSESGKHRVFLELLKKYGGWAVARYYTLNFYQNARPWLIKFFLGTEAVAVFNVAFSLLGSFKSLISFNALKVFLPRTLNDDEKMKAILVRGGRYITYLYAGLTLMSAAIVPAVLSVFFPQYIIALPYFFIIVGSMLFHGMTTIGSQILYSLRCQRDLFFIPLICLLVLVCLTAVLAPRLRLYGIAVEFFLTQLLTLYMTFYFIAKHKPDLKPTLKEILFFDAFDRELLLAGWRKLKKALKEI